MKLELVATATFGLEAVVRREIEALGYKVIRTEDGRVTYMGDERAIARSNLWLRSADRVYVRMGEFDASEFEELFQQTKALEWETMIPMEGAFPVVGGSVKSALHSVPACQSIIKKAVSVRLSEFYCRETLPETGAEYRIRFIAHKDRFLLLMDTSGAGLHKRGYRVRDVAAPMKETLAAALVQLSFYRKDRIVIDPCCGSGTIPIEAAMIARNIAPGLTRSFASEKWDIFDGAGADIWKEERRLAYEAADIDTPINVTGMDIDPKAVRAASDNADEAGLADDIDIIRMDMTKWEPGGGIPRGASKSDRVVVISNLPYGKRIGDDAGIKAIYEHIRSMMEECPDWSFFLITSDKMLEREIGRRADRRRKLYNGTIETQFYQFHGTKPKRETKE
ncbi:MAG: class I SAM-dependent RNA methyltransferase [Clostridiales bacterium]|nr:class I SAM-dependent RNA methyltransferase [Clostridiales bacterium]